jgi:hypothetical protein
MTGFQIFIGVTAMAWILLWAAAGAAVMALSWSIGARVAASTMSEIRALRAPRLPSPITPAIREATSASPQPFINARPAAAYAKAG